MPEATMQILVDAAIKGAAVLVLATAATALMRKTSAAKRHLIWVVAVSALLLIPVLSLGLPAWHVLPALERSAEVPVTINNTPVAEVPPEAAPQITTNLEMPSAHTEPMRFEATREPLSATSLILLAWLAGTLLVSITILLGITRVWWLARRAQPMSDGQCASTVHALAREQGISLHLLEGGDFAMPMTWGVLRPTLLLPRSARRWPAARLNAVLRHELAHIRRRDPLWQLVGEFACALHWFNPFAWYAARRMRIEREHACDDAVLTAGSPATEYAAELLDIARSLRAARATSVAAIAMARPRQLEGRLLAVLDDQRSRAEARRRWPVWVGGALLVLPLAALQPVREVAADIPTDASLRPRMDAPENTHTKRAPKRGATTQAATDKPIAIVHEPLIAHASMIGAFGGQQENCLQEAVRNVSISSHNDNDDYRRVKWETRSCSGTIEIHGNARIAGDLSGFEYIPPNGKVVIATRDNDHKRELTLTPAGDRFVYLYEVDGDRRNWDSEGQAWLSSVIQMLVRRAGLFADERVDYLLKTGGLNAVLQEVVAIQSDYVQRQYLTKTLGKTSLNGGAVESLLQVAGRELDSDYELTEFLIAVARKYDFTAGSRAAFIHAATTLESDYEHRRALSAVLKKGGLSSDDVTAMLTSAKDLRSDYEKAELLIGVAGRYRLEPRMRTAYLEATRGMSSDYEKKRVFTTVLKQGGLSATDLAYVLNATTTVRSDYERAQILKLVAADFDFTQPQLQEAYLKAAAEIDSDYELRQVLSGVLKRERLNAGGLNVVLAAAETIDSEYERAELLLQVLRSYTLNAEQRNRVIKMTDRMRSDYERGRVAALLVKQMSSQ